MYCKKSVRTRMDSSSALALIWFSSEDLQARTMQNHLYPTKEKIRLKIWHETPYHTLSESLDILSAADEVVICLLKTLAIIWDTTVRGTTVERKKATNRKIATFLKLINKLVIYNFDKNFTNRKTANRMVICILRHFPTYWLIKIWVIRKDFSKLLFLIRSRRQHLRNIE